MILLTLCRWACSLFLASVVSLILVLNELFTELNWFHISLAHARRVLSISPLRRSEAARSFWDLAMFSWVYLTHESGIVILWIKDVDDWYCTVKARSYAKYPRLARHFLVTFELLYFFAFFLNFYFLGIWVITMHRPFVNKKINKASMFACLTDFVQRSHIWWTKIWQNIKD